MFGNVRPWESQSFYFDENGSKVNSAKKSQSGKLGDGEVHRAGRCPLRKNLIREIKVQEE